MKSMNLQFLEKDTDLDNISPEIFEIMTKNVSLRPKKLYIFLTPYEESSWIKSIRLK